MIKKLKGAELLRLSADAPAQAVRVPLRFMLDNIRSGNNVGSFFRTADGFRLDGVVLTGISAQPPHRDILKTSLGAEKTVPWTYVANGVEALHALRTEGFKIAIIEQTTASISLEDWQPTTDEKWVVVMGNEVSGVAEELLALGDVCIEVPQFGTKHSFNVAVCGGIVSWEFMRKCGLSFLSGC
jgi:23S rRNA (guanosine2251-2'-O)-methyltransferase